MAIGDGTLDILSRRIEESEESDEGEIVKRVLICSPGMTLSHREDA